MLLPINMRTILACQPLSRFSAISLLGHYYSIPPYTSYRYYATRRPTDESGTNTRLTHVNPNTGQAAMVDVSHKLSTMRTARASGKVLMNKTTFDLVKANEVKKGDVLTVAQIAGIQAAKSTADLIPLCHPLLLTHVSLDFSLQDQNIGQDSRPVALSDQDPELTCAINIESSVRCCGETGVEMEALVAASTAALTIYDMCKAVSKNMQITSLRVLEKAGGKSGFWKADD